jgi:Ca-activated chloride channel family protein
VRYSFTILICLLTTGVFSQYYLRGEVHDLQNQPVPGVKILLYSKGGFPFYSGSSGAFGIPTSLKVDTITFYAEGFEVLKTAVETTQYRVFTLRQTNVKANSAPSGLLSFTKDLVTEKAHYPSILGESYSSTIENGFVDSREFPQTGFAINVDRASYSNIRRFLNEKTKPPVDAIRIEEMLNYFNLKTTVQTIAANPFSVSTTLTSCPWNNQNQLLFIHLQARHLNLENTPPSNLVFLIDVSGSMDLPNRLPLLQTAFKLLVENLRIKDTVTIVTYGGGVAVKLSPTSGNNKQKIIDAIESMKPSGSTPGEAAIKIAYRMARSNFIKNGNNRVILATDGDFNIGQTSEEELEELITQQKKGGIFLTCLGVGMGNYKDSKLETLAKNGNGNFAYLDCETEAEKVLVEEFAQTIYTIASDVKLTVHFNPELVKEYRLVGFDNRLSAIEDTLSTMKGGEVGSGHRLLSVFELTPTNKNIDLINATTSQDSVAQLKLSYKFPGKYEEHSHAFAAMHNYRPISTVDSTIRLAAAVIMFGSLMKHSKYTRHINWDDIYSLAVSSAKAGDVVQTGFLELVQKAKKIYGTNKRKW